MKNLLILVLSLALLQQAAAQFPNQDCVGAVPLCDISNQFSGSNGQGQVADLGVNSSSCLFNGESNSLWYRLQFSTAGQLVFAITPQSPNDDYDFSLFYMGNANTGTFDCEEIALGTAPEVRCSYAVTQGIATGLSFSGTGTSSSANGPDFLSPLSVGANDVYYLLLDNFSTGGQGFTLDLTGTTATLAYQDSIRLTYSYGIISNNHVRIGLILSLPFDCNTITNNFSEFTAIDNTGDTLSIVSVTCVANNQITLTIDPPAHAIDSVTVLLRNGSDNDVVALNYSCGRAALGETDVAVEVLQRDLDFMHLQYTDTFIFIPLAHPSATLRWFKNHVAHAPNLPGDEYTTQLNHNQPYEICLEANYGNFTDSVCKQYLLTGISETGAASAFQMYPNPANGQVAITLPDGAEWIEVTDVSGKAVLHLPATTTSLAFGTNGWAQGLYLVRVATRHGIAVQKLQVVH